MRPLTPLRIVCALLPSLALPQTPTFVAVPRGTHPGIVFSSQELPALRARATAPGIAGEAWLRVRRTALASIDAARLTPKAAAGRQGEHLAAQLASMALVYQVEGDRALGRKAVALLQSVSTGVDPQEFFRAVNSDFFATEHWPKAFAFAWDWLYELMTPSERRAILPALERWNAALFAHTEKWWWRDATINCGAIPVGAQGLLLTAIQAESRHPEFDRWFSSSLRKSRDNYFPTAWRASGVCNEGPGYAHYHRNPTQFFDALRRTGGPDLIPTSGAVNAMHYLRHQWMPQGGCGPIGDNTEYGRRVFQGIYLLGIRELADRAALWTFEHFTDTARIDPMEIFLYYPDGLPPVSPGTLDLPVSQYFEIDPNRAGNIFARSEWDNEQAHWFAFTTRYEEANHTHYDMNSFLFTAFGEPFATHANIYPYNHKDHGVDFEHNLVVVDEGGMPANDRIDSAGDDGSIHGLLTGIGLGHFADYVRGDARLSYADRSIRTSTPAERANRVALFVKQGANPYLIVADDIQKDASEHDYHWQWYTDFKALTGQGTPEQPFRIEGRQALCNIALLDPESPRHDFRIVPSINRRRPIDLGLLRVNRRGSRVRFLAAAVAWRKGSAEPAIRRGPPVKGNPGAASLVIEGSGFRDIVLWQPEEAPDVPTRAVTAGRVKTNAQLAMVRTDAAGRILGYVMGDGSSLKFGRTTLAGSVQSFSVSADERRVMATGPRRARQGQPPLPVLGDVRLLAPKSELWADGRRITPPRPQKSLVKLSGSAYADGRTR